MNRVTTEVLRDAIQEIRELHADVELFANGDVKLLNFVGTSLTDAGLATVALFSHLQRLYLGATHVTDAGLKHLEGLPCLEYVSLHGTEVTADGRNQLRTLLPNCLVCPRDKSAGTSSPVLTEPHAQQIPAMVSPIEDVPQQRESLQRESLQREILRRIQSLESEVVSLRQLIEQTINA